MSFSKTERNQDDTNNIPGDPNTIAPILSQSCITPKRKSGGTSEGHGVDKENHSLQIVSTSPKTFVETDTQKLPMANKNLEKRCSTLKLPDDRENRPVRLSTLSTPAKSLLDPGDMQKLQMTNKTLEKRVGNMMKLVESEAKAAKVAASRASQLEDKIKLLAEENHKLVSRKATLERELRELKTKLAPVDLSLAKVTKQKNSVIESLEMKLKTLQTEYVTVTSKSAEFARTAEIEMKALKEAHTAEVRRLLEEKAVLDAEKEELKQKLDQLSKTLEELEHSIESQKQEKKNLEQELVTLRTKLSELSGALDKEKTARTLLLDSNTSLEHKYKILQEEKRQKESELYTHVNLVEPRLQESSAALRIAEERIHSLKEELAKSSKSQVASKEQIVFIKEELSKTKTAAEHELGILKEENRNLSAAKENLFLRAESLQKELLLTEESLRATEKQIEALERGLKERERKYDEALAKAKSESDALLAKLSGERDIVAEKAKEMELRIFEEMRLRQGLVADAELHSASFSHEMATLRGNYERSQELNANITEKCKLLSQKKKLLREDLKKITCDLSSEKTANHHLSEEVQELRRETATLSHDLDAAQQLGLTLQVKIGCVTEELERLRKEKVQVQQELTELTQVERKASQTISTLQNEVTLLQREVELQRKNVVELERNSSETVAKLQVELSENRSERENLETEARELGRRIEFLKNQVEEKSAEFTALEVKLEETKRAYEEGQKKIGDLKDSLLKKDNDITGERSKFTLEIEELQQEVKALSDLVSSWQARERDQSLLVSDLKEKLAGETAAHIKSITDAEAHQRCLQQELTDRSQEDGAKIALLTDQLKSEKTEKDSFRQNLETTETCLEDTRSELRALQERAAVTERELSDKEKTVATLTEELSEKHSRVVQTESVLAAVRNEAEITRKELDSLIKENSEKIDECSALSARLVESERLYSETTVRLQEETAALSKKTAALEAMETEMTAAKAIQCDLRNLLAAANEKLTEERRLAAEATALLEDRHRDDLAQLQNLRVELTRQESTQNRELDALRERLREVGSVAETLAVDEKRAREEIGRLSEREAHQRLEIESLRRKNIARKASKARLEEELSETTTKVADAVEQAARLSTKCQQLGVEKAAAEETAARRIEDLQRELMLTVVKFETASNCLRETAGELDGKKVEVVDLREELASTKGLLDRTSLALETSEAHSRRVEEDLARTREDLRQARDLAEERRATLEETERRLNAESHRNCHLEEERTRIEADLTALTTRYSLQSQAVDELRTETSLLKEERQNDRAVLDQARHDLSVALSDLTTLKSANADLTQALAREGERASALEDDVRGTKHELAVCSQAFIAVQDEILVVRIQLNQKTLLVDNLQHDLNVVEQHRAEAEDALKAKTAELDAVKLELQHMVDKVAESKRDLEDTRMALERTETALEESRAVPLSELEVARQEVRRLEGLLDASQEEQQELQRLHDEYFRQLSNLTQVMCDEQVDKTTISGRLASAEAEAILLRQKLDDAHSLDSLRKQELDSFRREAQEKTAALQLRLDAELTVRTAREDRERKDNVSAGELEREHVLQTNLLRAEYEQKIAECHVNVAEAQRQHMAMSHDLNMTKRELDRLKEIVKNRDAKVEQFKEHMEAKVSLEQQNQILHEQLAQRDKDLAVLVARSKKLQLTVSTLKQESGSTQQLREENEKLSSKVEQLHLESKILGEQNRLDAARIEELLNEQAQPKNMNDKQKLDWVTKLKKENHELKRNQMRLQETLTTTQQALSKLKQAPTPSPRYTQIATSNSSTKK